MHLSYLSHALTCGLLVACSVGGAPPSDLGDKSLPGSFDANNVMSDAFFEDGRALTAEGIQAFLEASPYGRSWLAGHWMNGRLFSEVLAELAQRYRLNPIMLLSRLQNESSVVARRPSDHLLARAAGCHCPDGQGCIGALGFEPQLLCMTDQLREYFDGSTTRSANWNQGVSRTTVDGYRVTPQTHATAALYTYSPHVSTNRKNWQTTRTYLDWALSRGFDRVGRDPCGAFWDIGPDHPGCEAVLESVAQGWFSGCGDEDFCAEGTLTRAQLAVVLAKAFELEPATEGQPFPDVPRSAAPSVAALRDAGVLSGCGNGLFCPGDPVRRIEGAHIFAQLLRIQAQDLTDFADVAASHWGHGSAGALVEAQIATPCATNRFCPDQQMRRWHLAAWLVKGFDHLAEQGPMEEDIDGESPEDPLPGSPTPEPPPA